MKNIILGAAGMATILLLAANPAIAQDGNKIVHDAEYYVLYEQNGETWAAEDQDLDRKLSQLKEKFGQPPNIIHIMWDDMAYGDVGIPEINKIRGFDTPSLNRMADEGMAFVRMYTEPSCTPSRAAVMTGRHPTRHGMVAVGWPFEFGGLAEEEVTTAEVLSAAGYATGFFSKWHLGDIEESYPFNQGFDEAIFTPYNQLGAIWNAQGAVMNASLGIAPEILVDDPYELDRVGVQPEGWVMTIEGKKGEAGREWGTTDNETYEKIDPESEQRIFKFIRANTEAKKPFYVAYWPNYLDIVPKPKKTTLHAGGIAEGMVRLDAYIGRVMDELTALGIAENTLLIAMADNGPMVSKTPAGWGMSEMIFRGGKGQHWEGGVRVPAFAWWPGVIEPGQIVGDIFHETDLYTTFARLAGATEHVPTDRVVDGLDQTALIMNGDGHGRRDYVFIYTGPILAAAVKGRYKRVWAGGEGAASGIGAAFYDLYQDPKEVNPMLTPLIHTQSQFSRMRARHELMKEKYPDRPMKRGIPFTGLANARPETQAIGERVMAVKDLLPFDPMDFVKIKLPAADTRDPDWGQ